MGALCLPATAFVSGRCRLIVVTMVANWMWEVAQPPHLCDRLDLQLQDPTSLSLSVSLSSLFITVISYWYEVSLSESMCVGSILSLRFSWKLNKCCATHLQSLVSTPSKSVHLVLHMSFFWLNRIRAQSFFVMNLIHGAFSSADILTLS